MKTLFTSLFILLSNIVIAQDFIVIDNDKKVINITKQLSLVEDEENKLSIKDILKEELQSKFTKNTESVVKLKGKNKSTWIKFSLKNTSAKQLYMEIAHVGISFFEVYTPTSKKDSFQVQKENTYSLLTKRIIPINLLLAPLASPQDSTVHDFYIRFYYRGSFTTFLEVSTADNFLYRKHTKDIVYSIFFGVVLIMILYNFFIYLSSKDTNYLYYVLYTISRGSLILIGQGYFFEVFEIESIMVNQYVLFFSFYVFLISSIVFTISFLETSKYLPLVHKSLIGIIIALVVSFFIFLIDVYAIIVIWQAILFIVPAYLFIISIFIYLKGNKIVRFYSIAHFFFILGVIFFIIKNNSTFLNDYYFFYPYTTGIILEILFFSFALVDKINVIKKENQEIQKSNLDLIKTQKESLEVEVKKRTEELEEKNQEIVSLNTNLESLVSQRTEELKDTLDNLAKQNQDLSQFSYIISHNLRSPVARILGLVNIFNEKDYNDDFNKQIFSHLKQTTIDLNVVIKDLTQIITIRTDLSKTKEEINILDIINVQKFLLQSEIEKSKAIIDTELVSIKSIHSIKGYVQSILYNLLSNAIKYKSDKRSPIIKLKTELVDDFVCLSVQDNGLGIDLTTTDTYKIFGLYQRMHNHVDGKGLGLFLVKTQIESMGGRIEIESQLDVGTTFKVYFPNVV